MTAAGPALDRPAAERLVKNGDVPVAVVIPRGLGEAFGQSGFGGGPAIVLLADPSDPIAPNMVGGLMQKVTMTAAPDLMMQGGMRQFETHAGALTPQQRAAVDQWIPQLKPGGAPGAAGGAGDGRRRGGRRRHALRQPARLARLVLRRRHRRDVPALLDGRRRRLRAARGSRVRHARASAVHHASACPASCSASGRSWSRSASRS